MLTRENKIYLVWAKEVWDIKVQRCHSRWLKEETHKLPLLPGQGHDSSVVLMPTRHLLKLPPLDLLICILASSILGVPDAHSKCCVSSHMSSHIHFIVIQNGVYLWGMKQDSLWLLLRVEFRCVGSDNSSWKLAKDARVNCFWWSGVMSLVTRGTRLYFP